MAKFQRKTRQERETEIKEAALDVFVNKGYRNTTMEDIIAGTTLSKGGVYRYFSSPKEIMIAIMRDGNDVDNKFFREIRQEINSKEDICNLLADRSLDKILSTSPQKKLYLMFIYEILYDKKLENIFLGFEKQTFIQLENLFGDKISFFKDKNQEMNRLFMSRLINALLFVHALFSDKQILESNKDYLHKIFFDFYNEYL
ncbi:TetR/AcrR family transcriptional regulator [Vallitalea guaymasensis]|uniref:TetR/AcrR family transcriptional regulator n=1 Tax=Vallitalea guaymasensis TaxID=1185412 RepID=A0A8J8MEU3_9FIRM|nr:TetR/AcrR family transcriptional regulator [Vallitalea guaymasensis]QUH31617.1 TetR/AcrR family transcriptional regulator [Vallitalea guaymasensis]